MPAPAETEQQQEQPQQPAAAPAQGGNGQPGAAQAGSSAPGTPSASGGKTLIVRSEDYAKFRREAEERAQRKAQAAQEAQAKELGFASVGEMIDAAKRSRAGGGGDRRPQNGGGGGQQGNRGGGGQRPAGQNGNAGANGQPASKEARAFQRVQEQLTSTTRKHNDMVRRNRKLKEQLEFQRSDAQLRTSAARAGVQDIDYAVHLLRQHAKTIPETETKSFDDAAYFGGLRKTHPHLFGEMSVPVTTGTAGSGTATGGAQPNPPRAGDAATKAAGGGPVDTRTMSPEQYREHLRKQGLTPP